MLRLALVVAVISCSGCAQALRNMNGEEDPDAALVRAKAAVALECNAKSVTAIEDGEYKPEGFKWSARGCGRASVCRQLDDDKWECRALPLKFRGKLLKKGADGHHGVVAAIFAVAGCTDPDPEIWLLGETERRGTARIGAIACGRSFNCMGEVSRKNDLTDDATKCFEIGAASTEEATVPVTPKATLVDRIAIETGCAKSEILVGEAVTLNGVQVQRLSVCGKPYVCSTTESNRLRTDCKAASAQEENAAPP